MVVTYGTKTSELVHVTVSEIDDWVDLLDISALLCYFVGALAWLVVAIWALWVETDTVEPSVLSCLASSSFLVYGSVLLYRWYLCRAQKPWYKGGVSHLRAYNWELDLPIVVTFWLGTLGDLSTSLLDTSSYLNPERRASLAWASLATDIFASHFWFVSGFLELIKWGLDRYARHYHQAPFRYTLRPFPKHRHYFYDWAGAGAFFFFPGALGYAIGAYLCGFAGYFPCWASQLVGALGFMCDAICQLIHYARPIPLEPFEEADVINLEDRDPLIVQ